MAIKPVEYNDNNVRVVNGLCYNMNCSSGTNAAKAEPADYYVSVCIRRICCLSFFVHFFALLFIVIFVILYLNMQNLYKSTFDEDGLVYYSSNVCRNAVNSVLVGTRKKVE